MKRRKLLVVILTLCLAIAAMTVMAFADIASGTDWVISDDGTLTISSDSGMEDFWSNRNTYAGYVKSLVTTDDVTYISTYLLAQSDSLESVTIGSNVTNISSYAFRNNANLKTVIIKSKSLTIYEYAFYVDVLIADVYFAGSEDEWNSLSIPSSGNVYLTQAFIHYNCSSEHSHTHSTNFEWSSDYSSCTATISCSGCSSTNVIDCEVSSEVTTEATCDATGLTTYTATAKIGYRAETYTDTQEVTIAATGHSTEIQNAKDATCTEDGYTGDEVCTVCGETVTTGEVIPATGHTYGDPVFNWTGYEYCDVGFPCLTCGVSEYQPATVTSETTAATCTEDGKTVYTATVTFNGTEYTDTQTVAISATGHTVVTDEAVAATCTETGLTEGSHCSVCSEVLVAQEVVAATGHAWGETAYTWSEDGSSCTATHTCGNDSSHVEEATATITSEQTLAPTCTEKGETTYTATFSEDWAETQTLTVADVDATGHTYEAVVTDPTCTEQGYTTYTCTEGDDSYVDDYTEAIGHSYGEPVWAWDTNGGATATFTCENDSSHVEVVTATITATGNLGVVTKVATVTFNGETYSISQTSGTSLQSLAADYTAVREAIAKANALNASDYTNFANVTSAINAVNWNLNMLSQSTVNGYAEAIETAIKNLVSVDLTEETVNIEEPVEDTDTDTEEEEMEVSDSEPETESELEANPTTGMALALVPMVVAMAAVVAGKRK